MSTQNAIATSLIDTTLGDVLPGTVQFIRQAILLESDPVAVDLPGQITRCEGAAAFAVKPHARLLAKTADGWRAATIGGEVTDERGLDRALAGLADKIAPHTAGAFAIRLSVRASFGQLLDRAELALGGCGCQGSGGAKLPGTIRVGLAVKPGGKLVWSEPVAALMHARAGDEAQYDPVNPEAGATLANQTCKSNWHGIINRWTECVGSCTTKKCKCEGKPGVWVAECVGWTTCWCR